MHIHTCTHIQQVPLQHVYFVPQASPYANIGLAFVKLIDMTAGGPDDSIFGYGTSSGDGRVEVPFSGVSYFLWVIFIVIMAILFINFLVSMCLEPCGVPWSHVCWTCTSKLATNFNLMHTTSTDWSCCR